MTGEDETDAAAIRDLVGGRDFKKALFALHTALVDDAIATFKENGVHLVIQEDEWQSATPLDRLGFVSNLAEEALAKISDREAIPEVLGRLYTALSAMRLVGLVWAKLLEVPRTDPGDLGQLISELVLLGGLVGEAAVVLRTERDGTYDDAVRRRVQHAGRAHFARKRAAEKTVWRGPAEELGFAMWQNDKGMKATKLADRVVGAVDDVPSHEQVVKLIRQWRASWKVGKRPTV
jgi:hypothetical protein